MRIAVIGAGRGVGGHLVEQALAAGHEVTAVSRHLGQLPPGAVGLRSSILAPGAAAEAVAGADAVAWCAGSRAIGPAWLRRVSLFSRGTAALLAAMARAAVRRLVVVTGVGAGDSRGHGGLLYDRLALPLLLGAIYADKDRQEALIRASDTDWTICRPALLTDGPPTGRYRVVHDLAGVTARRIARTDVAHYLLRALAEGIDLRRTVLLAG